jgi:hypothetical protein
VRVKASDPSLTSAPVSRDFELTVDNVPEVTGVVVVDGTGWQGTVKRVRVLWDMAVNLTPSALQWRKTDIGNANVSFTVQTSLLSGRTVADVQFLGTYVDSLGLLDGGYELTVAGDQVTAVSSSLAGLGFVEQYQAIRPKNPFAMRIELASPVGISSRTSMNVQVVGLDETENGIRYEIDWNSDGVVDRTVLGGSSFSIDDVSFASGGSRTVQVEAIRAGQTIAKGRSVVDVVPFTTQGSNWYSVLDVNLDNSISALDVLAVVNRLNSRRSLPYDLRLDVNRDRAISALDVLVLVNHLNSSERFRTPNPFVSVSMADTGASDGLTADAGVTGVVKDASAKLFASLDGNPRKEVVGAIGTNGRFDLTDAAMASLFGGGLEGDHVLTLGTVGSDGRWQAMDRRFSRTNRVPGPFEIVTAVQNGGLQLAWTSAGAGMRYRVYRTVEGQTPQLLADGLAELTTQINLPLGLHELYVEAYDYVGNKSRTQALRVTIR